MALWDGIPFPGGPPRPFRLRSSRNWQASTAAPIARNTSGYASPALHSAHTSRLSSDAPLTNRTPGSRHASSNISPPSARLTAQVNAAPKRIASGSKRYSVNPARERMNPSLPPSPLETHTGSGSMPTRLIALACSIPGRNVVGVVMFARLLDAQAVEQLAVDREGQRHRTRVAHRALGNGEIHGKLQARHVGNKEAQDRVIVDPAPGSRPAIGHVLHQIGVGIRIGHGEEIAEGAGLRHGQRGPLRRRWETLRQPRATRAPGHTEQRHEERLRHESRL